MHMTYLYMCIYMYMHMYMTYLYMCVYVLYEDLIPVCPLSSIQPFIRRTTLMWEAP